MNPRVLRRLGCLLLLVFLGTPRAGAAPAAPAAPATPPATGGERPEWLVGEWWSEQQRLNLSADGGYLWVDFGPAGPQPGKNRMMASGPGAWSALAEPGAEGAEVWTLRGLTVPARVRRARAAGSMLLREEPGVWETPFQRLGKEAEARGREAQSNLDLATQLAGRGDLAGADRKALLALKQFRQPPEPCVLPASSAAFLLARIRQGMGRPDDAAVFFDECIRLRSAGYETPHPQTTRAFFFAGQLARGQGGYERSLYYFVGALDVQFEVLRRTEAAGAAVGPELLQSIQAESAAVMLEAAGDCGQSGFTPGVVALLPEAARLAMRAGDPMLPRVAAVGLFSHLLARPKVHSHSRILFSAAGYLESLDRAQEKWSEEDLLGKALRDARVAGELVAMQPARTEVARRLALRAAALGRVGDWKRAPYVRRQILPEMLTTLGLTQDAAALPEPPAGLGAGAVFPLSRRDLEAYLDRVAAPVDLAAEFREWELEPGRFPSGAPPLEPVMKQLRGMQPMHQNFVARLAPSDLEEKISALLSGVGP